MFKKLMAMIKSPKNSGGDVPKLGGQRWVKSYDVVLANMEGSPSYPLSHQLSIGSEIGNIIINDPSVSPRHASILLQEEVISIIDHASVAGTFVNGTKIPAGKFIILEDTDTIRVGDLEVKLTARTSAIEDAGLNPPGHDDLDEEASEEDEEVPEEESEEAAEAEEEEEVEEDVIPDDGKTITKSRVYMGNPKAQALGVKAGAAKKKRKISFSLPSYDASNSIIRVMALSADLLLSYVILVVFIPFDDFRNFLDSIPALIEETIDFRWVNIWHLVTEEAGPQVTDFLKEVFVILNDIVPVLHLVLIFFIVRLITTAILGVSISEFMFGIRGNFNGIWARIGGILRVVIGMITWPFLIFDLPSVASKRTFKEFITFTNTYVASRVTLFFGIVFYSPLLVVLLLLSPMFVGLELVEPITINTAVSQRVKPKPPEGADVPVIQKLSEGSRFLGVSLSYDPSQVSLIPSFEFKGDKSKLNMKANLEIFHREGERNVTLELFKTFDMKELLMVGLRGNYFLHNEYQTLYNYAFSAENTNRFFKVPENPKQEEMFGNQVVNFTEMTFGLGIETLPDFVMAKTPLIKSVVDYRTTLLGLFEYKDFSEINVIKLGKLICLRVTYDKQKPFDLIMPLVRGQGRIYKITFDKKDEIAKFRNQVYKFTFDELLWGTPEERESIETFKGLEVIDVFTSDLEKAILTSSKAQALYGYYFEKSAEVMKAGNAKEYDLWKVAVQDVMNIIPHLREKAPEAATAETTPAEPVQPPEDVKAKLKSNFSDLFNALENKNKQFFGIEESPTV